MDKLFKLKVLIISSVIAAIVASAGTGFAAWKLHQWKVAAINAEHKDALVEKENIVKAECQAAMDDATEVSNDYQNTIAKLRRDLAERKRVQPRCVPIIRDNPSERPVRRDGGTGIG